MTSGTQFRRSPPEPWAKFHYDSLNIGEVKTKRDFKLTSGTFIVTPAREILKIDLFYDMRDPGIKHRFKEHVQFTIGNIIVVLLSKTEALHLSSMNIHGTTISIMNHNMLTFLIKSHGFFCPLIFVLYRQISIQSINISQNINSQFCAHCVHPCWWFITNVKRVCVRYDIIGLAQDFVHTAHWDVTMECMELQ